MALRFSTFRGLNSATGRFCEHDRGYQIDRERDDVRMLAEVVDINGYLKNGEEGERIGGSPLIVLRIGQGMVIASEMILEAETDLIAGRLCKYPPAEPGALCCEPLKAA
jgi:hypothetical protein